MGMRVRVFEVMQFEVNPRTGESLGFGEEQIKDGLAHRSIKHWAYICHDRDPYTQHDWDEYLERNGDEPAWQVGDAKPRHWHVVGSCPNKIDIEALAKWFSVPVQQIEVPRGRDAFLDKVEYLTHERTNQQALGKTLYDDSEVAANFDFRQMLNERNEKRLKYGRDVSPKDEWRYKVLHGEVTLREVCVKDPIAYQNDYATLDKFRLKYINDYAPMPEIRRNFYVCGKGGVGKGLICRAIARSLYPELENDDDIFFEVGAKGAAFEGYDGQPVIIWNDRRAIDLLQELNGRGNVFNVFDTHPSRGKQNVKYSSISLTNEVNIVNSVQDYREFLDGLAGEYKGKSGEKFESEDRGQSYRRFPFIIPLHEDDFDLLMNMGYWFGTREYDQYFGYMGLRGNMQKIHELCTGNVERARQLEASTVKLVKEKHEELLAIETVPRDNEAEIQAYMEGLGQPKSMDPVIINLSEERDDD